MNNKSKTGSDVAVESPRLVIPKLKGVRIRTLRAALAVAAEEAFKAEMLDTEMWQYRDAGDTKEQWIHDRISDWISFV